MLVDLVFLYILQTIFGNNLTAIKCKDCSMLFSCFKLFSWFLLLDTVMWKLLNSIIVRKSFTQPTNEHLTVLTNRSADVFTCDVGYTLRGATTYSCDITFGNTSLATVPICGMYVSELIYCHHSTHYLFYFYAPEGGHKVIALSVCLSVWNSVTLCV